MFMNRRAVEFLRFAFASSIAVSLLLAACAGNQQDNARNAPTTFPTNGLAPEPPSAPPSLLGAPNASHYRALALRVGPCRYAHAENRINGVLYIGCYGGDIAQIGARGRALRGATVLMDGIASILPVGNDAIAISGWSDGAALRQQLTILRASTMRPIVKTATDSTFLGVLGDRAYIDDWCCNGRPDVYSPATIYSISLKDGTGSPRVDLAPDPELHPANEQPLGQGAHNYMVGDYFYVVVGPVAYRYDVRDLTKAPLRLRAR
jgi:hypothetical protein